MKPVILISVAIVAIIGAAAIAFAASGGGGSADDSAQAGSPPPSESPIPVEPDGGIGDTPLPVEPDGGIGDTPLPVKPDEGNGSSDTPIPVEPDGGIGTTPPTVNPDAPIPSEPPFTVTPTAPQPALPAGRYADAAPIDQLDVRIAESFPPQYFVYIQAGLPSGCAQQYTHSVARTGNVIEVEVLNSFPEGSPACTMIYGMYELNVALGGDFVPGETYTVSVNGGAAETQFTAQ